MPFTPSHAVVALPFVRTPLPAAAIAVGAMTPDLPLFVRAFPETYGMTHSFAWLPVTVLVGLGLLLMWRCILRPAARELSPRWLAARLPEEWDAGAAAGLVSVFVRRGGTRPSASGAVLTIAALAIGVATHLVWDAFTHEGRWGMTSLDLGTMWGPLPAYKWLQYGSSAFGLIVIALWSARWLIRRRRVPAARVLPAWLPRAWWVALPAALAIAWFVGIALWPLTAEFTAQHLAYRVLPLASAIWGLSGVLLAVAVQYARARAPRG